MKHLSSFNVFLNGITFKMRTAKGRKKIQTEKLKQLVEYAKTNSPYYQKLYSQVGENFELRDLPPTNKVNLMENFDSWVTDRDVKLNNIHKYMENKDNIGRLFQDKYLCFTTSGSTGYMAIILYDETALNVMKGIIALRSIPGVRNKIMFFLRGCRSVGIYSGGHFFFTEANIRNLKLKGNRVSKYTNFIDVLQPLPKIVEQLNELQPVFVGSYTTALTILAEEQKSGRLKIKPTIVNPGGECVSEEVLADIKETFNCATAIGYSTAECGMVTFGCKKNRYHINEDWSIVEPVNKNNEPVAPGQKADKLLITNLSNFIQPYIRYETFDTNIYHEERCECGNPSPWIEVEGRTDDILEFDTEKGKVQITPLAIQAFMKDVREIKRYQLVLHGDKKLELRIVSEDNKLYFEKIKILLDDYLKTLGVNIEIYLSDEEPKSDKSGKFKHVIQKK